MPSVLSYGYSRSRSRRRTGPAAMTCAGSNNVASDTSAPEAASCVRWMSCTSALSAKRPAGAASATVACVTGASSSARAACRYGAAIVCMAGSIASESVTVRTALVAPARVHGASDVGRVKRSSTRPSASPLRPACVTSASPTRAPVTIWCVCPSTSTSTPGTS